MSKNKKMGYLYNRNMTMFIPLLFLFMRHLTEMSKLPFILQQQTELLICEHKP